MTTSTLTLTDFLLARIAEDEATAKYATTRGAPTDEDFGGWWLGHYDHANRWSPGRVLAECEAKRRIVEAYADAEMAVTTYDNDDPNNPPSHWQEWGNRHALRLAVEFHAAVYAGHPDYRDDWRP